MDRKSWRIDPEFDELADVNMPLDDIWWNLEVISIFGVHIDTIHQLVSVGELLGLKVLFEVHTVILPALGRGR